MCFKVNQKQPKRRRKHFSSFLMPSIFPIIYAINIITATRITNIDVAITNNNINTDTIILSTANSIAATLPLHHLLCHHEYPIATPLPPPSNDKECVHDNFQF